MTVQPLSHSDVVCQLQALISEVSPYRPRFTQAAAFRLPLWGFDVPLSEAQFDALCRCVAATGETAFAYGPIERFQSNDMDWLISCDDFHGYQQVEAYVESMYSGPSGDWLIISSSEGHSVAASSTDVFIEALALELNIRMPDDAFELIDYWRTEIYGVIDDWASLRAGPPDWMPHLFAAALPPDLAHVASARYRARFDTL